MPTVHINPSGVSQPTGYTHVVRADGSRTIYFSGQVAVNGAGELVGANDLAKQADQVFENLRLCLLSVGAGFQDVVKFTTYVVNFKPEDRAVVAAARQKHLPAVNPPASTAGRGAIPCPAGPDDRNRGDCGPSVGARVGSRAGPPASPRAGRAGGLQRGTDELESRNGMIRRDAAGRA
jgi:enamine deaminase RidA (YjgF/YER057c/UK114 family)